MNKDICKIIKKDVEKYRQLAFYTSTIEKRKEYIKIASVLEEMIGGTNENKQR